MATGTPYLSVIFSAGFRVCILALLLFLPAQNLRWTAGWLCLLLYAAWSGLNIALLGSRSPELLRLRETVAPAASEPWDKFFVFFGAALLATTLFICGIEGPASGFTALAAAAFLPVCGAGALFTWALLSNPFAIGVAAIQPGQTAVDKGPYRAVRHPIYLAGIVVLACTPAALGSPSAYPPAGLLAAGLAARAALEDRLLLRSLPGYKDYAGRVPYRLLPGFW